MVTNDAYYPDVPPHLVKCINQKPRPGKTADEIAVNTTLTDEERKKCSLAMLKWYQELQRQKRQSKAELPPLSN